MYIRAYPRCVMDTFEREKKSNNKILDMFSFISNMFPEHAPINVCPCFLDRNKQSSFSTLQQKENLLFTRMRENIIQLKTASLKAKKKDKVVYQKFKERIVKLVKNNFLLILLISKRIICKWILSLQIQASTQRLDIGFHNLRD